MEPAVSLPELAVAVLTLLFGLGSLLGSLYLIRRALVWRAAVAEGLAAVRGGDFRPKAALLVPTRGEFSKLEANLQSLLEQDYPDLRVVLTVDSRAEPLFAALESLVATHPAGSAVVVAVEDRPAPAFAAGKCAAQLRGLAEVAPDVEVFVFADDDIRPGPEWLGHLVAALADPAVGVATAYRWYFSRGGGIASHIRAAWNLVGLQIMFESKWNFAWGGGMAIRRSDFEAWGIANGWERAISDDYVVTMAAKKEARPIRFVPKGLAPSYEHVAFPQMLEWCRRQTFMTSIYDPALWKFALAPYLFFNGLLALGAFLLLLPLLGVTLPWWVLLPAVAFVLHCPLNLVKAAVFYGGVLRMLPDHEMELRGLKGAYLAGSALAPFVMIYSLLKTRKLTRIEWRGRAYEVHGPTNVRPL